MQIAFTKMQGLGNDFIIFDNISNSISLTPEQIRFIANRRFGIGCDQLLFVEASHKPGIDFRYRIFNANGEEVQQCGNGARCFARFVVDKGLTDKSNLVIETHAGLICPQIEANGDITVNMGVPRLNPVDIPFNADEVELQYPIMIGTDLYKIGAVSLGNPHAVLLVDSIETAPVETVGVKLSLHHRFPQHANVSFMQIIDNSNIKLRVYERGVGETLACGTGACAAVVVGQRLKRLDSIVTVNLPGGNLQIQWAGEENAAVLMTGPAVHVFEGTIEL
ncbi:MAG: diaminopimelate epimerase [Thioploca sp.]|nr:diaminopimelate epimerase [Thioploca sp.]